MLACHTNFLFRKIAHLYLVFLHFYVAGMSKKGKIIKEIKKSEERRKSIQNTRVVKESVLIQYANSLTDIQINIDIIFLKYIFKYCCFKITYIDSLLNNIFSLYNSY